MVGGQSNLPIPSPSSIIPLMRYAIFSDIHNNDHALSQVLRDTYQRNIDAYLCLGDIGTDPSVQLVRGVNAESVFGNWEITGWQYVSRQLQQQILDLPPMRKYDDFWISHAAPTWPNAITSLQQFLQNRTNMSSVFPYYVRESDELWRAFSELLNADIPLLFHGHTHQQIVWTLTNDNSLKQSRPQKLEVVPGNTYIVGVGSVGQPKDSAHPSYVVFDADTLQIEFIRVK
jgi:predicted phosphodiesterase